MDKLKFKTKYDADGVERVHFWLNAGPYEQDYLKYGEAPDVKEEKNKETGARIISCKPCEN